MRFDEIVDGLATLRFQDQVSLQNSQIDHMEATQEAIRSLLSAVSNPIYRAGIEQTVRAIQTKSLVSGSETHVASESNSTKKESPKKGAQRLYPKKIWISQKTWRTPFGTMALATQKLSQQSNLFDGEDSVYEKTFEFRPSLWFLASRVRIGLRTVLSNAALGGGIYWRTFRAVPYDALIFHFCRQGNIDSVRLLLERGEALVWDTAPNGEMPLHVSISDWYSVVSFL